jgi:hypothetical protein
MLHLLPTPAPESNARSNPEPYAEAVSRLASVRHAIRLVEPFGHGPASDLPDDDREVAAAWDEAGESRRRHFDKRSAKLVGATAAGVEALLVSRQAGFEPHAEASKTLVDQIRRELADVARVVLA